MRHRCEICGAVFNDTIPCPGVRRRHTCKLCGLTSDLVEFDTEDVCVNCEEIGGGEEP